MKSEVNRNDRISPAEKRETVDLILQSKGFQRAPRLREFLRFVCDRTQESGDPPQLREQDIGRAVYQRPENYNPSEDNIVRVEARNLRRKLEEFFSEDGKDLPLRVHIPRGAYVPVFERRALPEAEPAPIETEVELAPSVPAAPLKPANLERMILSLLIIVLAISCGFLWLRNESLQAGLASPRGETAEAPFWPMLFDAQHNTYLVLADSGLVAVQDLLKRRLTLSDYLKRDHGSVFHANDPKNERQKAAELIGLPYFTSVTGARFVGSVFNLPGISRDRLSVKYAREMEPRDFKTNHVILIGSSRSNPWVELFEPRLNFRFEYDFTHSRPVVRNQTPGTGELPAYEAGGPDGNPDDLYSTIALVPNLSGDGNVLIVSGTGIVGTESASEMLFNNALAWQMIRKLNLQKDGHMQFFEVLLKSSRLGTTSRSSEIVAYRILQK